VTSREPRPRGAGFAIAAAGALDVDGMATVHAACFDEPWSRTDFARILAAPSGFGLVARVPAGPAGFVLGRFAADECEILTLAVAPPHRRHGIAAGLLRAAMAMAAARGVHAFFLEVAEDNGPARALYAGAGFRRVGVREGYYRRGAGRVDGLTLKRGLDDESAI
jgi:ribosomal-protein-alanine N-acetyltransferase